MKRIFILALCIIFPFVFCSCYSESGTQDQATDITYEEPTCDEVGHDYVNGKCSRCEKIIEVNMQSRIGKPTTFDISKNYVDGIELSWIAINNSGKTIKYCTIEFAFLNRVGDPAYDDITGLDYKKLRLIGPVAPGEEIGMLNEIIGYSSSCSKVTIKNFILEYEDGSFETGTYGWSISQ